MKEKIGKGRKMKRLLSVVLAVAMVVTLMPMNSLKVYAATTYEITYNYSTNPQWSIPSAAKSAKEGDKLNVRNTTTSSGNSAISEVYQDGTKKDSTSTKAGNNKMYTIPTGYIVKDITYNGKTLSIYLVTPGYTITYNTNGGSSVAQATDKKTIVFPSTDPTKSGWAFDGWYTNESCTTKAVDGTSISSNITLYAKWIHTHGSWTYSVGTGDTANVLYATCGSTNGDCPLPNKHLSLTLTATSPSYSGSAVTASYGSDEATAWKTATTKDAPTIAYEKKNETNTWESIASAPSTVGSYRAVAKFTNAGTDYTAYKEFSISPASINPVSFTEPSVAATGTPATATNLAIASNSGYTGAISWSPADTSFGYNKIYEATVTLSAKDNYVFADDVTIPTGWTKDTAKSTATSLVLTKTYDAIKAKITSITEPSVTSSLTSFTTESAQLADLPASVAVTVEDSSVTSMAITWQLKSGTTYSRGSEAENVFVWTIVASEYANYDTNGKALTGEVTIKNPVHIHDWMYTADSAKLTAKCEGEGDCTVTNGKTDGVSLTLTATTPKYSGSGVTTGWDYGQTVAYSLTGQTNWTSASLSTPTISYYTDEDCEDTHKTTTGADGSGASIVGGAPANVGTYWVAIKATNASSPSTTVVAKEKFEIKKIDNSITAVPSANTLTYTGVAQDLVTAGTSPSGTLYYRLGTNGSWSTNIPSATAAKIYTVYYYVKGDSNHKDLGSESSPYGSVNVTISPKEVGLSWGNTAFTYNGSTQAPTATATGLVSGDTCTVTVTGGQTNASNSAYTATASSLSNSNYALPSDNTQTFTIAQKEITAADITWSDTGLTYTGSEQKPTATIKSSVICGSDTCTVAVIGGQTDASASAYTATADSLSNSNYKLPDTKPTTSFTIAKANQAAPSLTANNETISEKQDGTITGLTTVMEYRLSDASDYTEVANASMNFASGTYKVRYKENANHNAGADATVEIAAGRKLTVTLPDTQTGYTIAVSDAENDWHATPSLTFTLKAGYSETDAFKVKVNGQEVTLDAAGESKSYTLPAMEDDVTVTVEGVADTTKPTGEISIETNGWTSFLSTITFGLFFKETKDVNITAADAGSGIDTIKYYISETALTEVAVTALAETAWTTYTSFSIAPNKKCVIYAKITDKAGNVTYISSDGLIFENGAPVIAGITSGTTYCHNVEFTVTDEYLDTVKANDTVLTSVDGKYTLPSYGVTYNVVATDKAGNSTTIISVTTRNAHDYSTDWTSDETNHWHAATCVHTDEISGKTAHTWNSGAVTTEPTTRAAGVKTYTCTVCGQTRTEAVAKLHSHTYATTWSKDATHHWHAATCSHTSEISDKAVHTYGNWSSNNDATTRADGTKSRTCSICGYKQTVTDVGSKIENTDSEDNRVNRENDENTNQGVESESEIPEEYEDLLSDSDKQSGITMEEIQKINEKSEVGDKGTAPVVYSEEQIEEARENAPVVEEENIANTTITEDTVVKVGEGSVLIIVDSVDKNHDREGQVITGFVATNAENVLHSCLTEEERELVASGGDVVIRVLIKKVEETVPEDDAKQIEKETDKLTKSINGLKIGEYVDITLQKQIGNSDWQRIRELDEELEVSFDVPEIFRAERRTYLVMRNHEGVCDLLYDQDENQDSITIRTHLFSTYAILYTDEEVELNNLTLESCNWHFFILALTIIALLGIWLLRRRKLKVSAAILAGDIVLAIIFTILGSCIMDVIMLIGSIALCGVSFAMQLKRK